MERWALLCLLVTVPLAASESDLERHDRLDAKSAAPHEPPLPMEPGIKPVKDYAHPFQKPVSLDAAVAKDEEAIEAADLVVDARKLADSSLGFWHGFVASISVIIVSELGDKTWFIAAILAMRHPRLTVFAGAIAALALMTALSAGLGWATQIIPRKFTYYISTALFAIFGLKMLKEGYDMSPSVGQEEYEEAQAEIKKKEEEDAARTEPDVEAGGVAMSQGSRIARFVSKIFVESFTLTFLAEWGDRSQLTTIILAAREDVVGVTLGGILGHAICTGIAVIGGRMVAQRISVRTVTIIGGVVFIVFALSALFLNPDGE